MRNFFRDVKPKIFRGFCSGYPRSNFPNWFKVNLSRQEVIIHALVKPKSKNYRIVSDLSKGEDEPVMINITQEAKDGKANLDVIYFLSERTGIDENSIEILKGKKSKEKILRMKLKNYFGKNKKNPNLIFEEVFKNLV